MDRRQFTVALAATLAAPAFAYGAPPQAAGSNPTLFVPSADGGGWNRTARALRAGLIDAGVASEVVIVNQFASAEAGIAEFARRYEGDRDALLVGGLGMVGAAMMAGEPDDLQRLTPVMRLACEYKVLAVAGDSELASLPEFLAWMGRHPDPILIAGGNRGNVDYLFTGMIVQAAHVPGSRVRYLPFIGGIGASAEVLARRADAVVGSLNELRNDIEIGRLRALAISSAQRVPGAAIATCDEQGTNLKIANWRGVFAPPGVHESAIARQQMRIERALATMAWRTALIQYSWRSHVMTGPAFRRFVSDETALMRRRLAGIRLG